ncbi:MAG: UDP-N-acetylmuramoyl-tripeptide--D-alanyl-D-alanine ligase [Gemmatimonadaceae bacterium]|nr:UDP-N-acetylmuramoyl-tripeptide--D-alanyl-D-alanine ligase [Gemmatimonadaceae bacterium]
MNGFWTLDSISDALGEMLREARPRGAKQLTAITTDSRSIKPGELFVALKGENFDGHSFVADVVRAGAAAVLVSDAARATGIGVPAFVVDDTLIALGRLGTYWRRVWGKTVIGVAGSNGKTSTKELLRAALSQTFEVHATTGNLNNRIGVPLTLLAIPPETDVAVIELGTSLPGEVAILRDIAMPDIAIVTSVAEEHLEGLGDLRGVLQEEVSVFDGVSVGIVPNAQPEIGEAAKGRAKRLASAGLDAGDLKATRWEISPEGLGKVVVGDVEFSPPIRGAHNLRNMMLALAAATECGVDLAAAARGISNMPQPKMRVAWEKIGNAILINDAYNANPGSTRAAIELITSSGDARQRVIVLGTMRELGPKSEECHDDMAVLALQSGAQVVAGIGDFSQALERVGKGDARIVTAEDVDDLWPKLATRLAPDAIILLKASRGVQLERLVPHITAWAGH